MGCSDAFSPLKHAAPDSSMSFPLELPLLQQHSASTPATSSHSELPAQLFPMEVAGKPNSAWIRGKGVGE